MTVFSNIEAVLFDLDGTLIDSAPDLAAAADKMRMDRGMASLDYAAYRPMAGAGARGMLGVAFGVEPSSPEFVTLREEFFVNYENCMTERTYVFDGVAELLGQLQSLGLAWGVVTNKSQRFTGPLTLSMALFNSAKTIISGDTTPYAKPHPEPLFEAARQLQVEPERCLYVGDDERDVIAGLAAGMITVAASYGYLGAAADFSAWGAHASINSPIELLQLLHKA